MNNKIEQEKNKKEDNIMTIGGIIAEYNFFHNGHKFQIDEFKKRFGISHLVVVISGNYVQRGGASILDKYSKVKSCLDNGVDLILEIPTIFATQTAELFARGAVRTLDSLSCVDFLCFGSESGDIDVLKSVADFIDTDGYEILLKKHLDAKESFPVARSNAIYEGLDKKIDLSILSKPNNILAIEYLKELNKISSNIAPVTVKREAVDHNSKNKKSCFASATALRTDLLDIYDKFSKLNESETQKNDIIKYVEDNIGKYIPKKTMFEIQYAIENNYSIMNEESFKDELFYSIIDKQDKLDSYFEVVEGIENLLKKNVILSSSLNELVEMTTSKRYSAAKIRRMLYNILLNIDKQTVEDVKNLKSLPYIRVLGLNKKGGEILKLVKNNSNVIIVDRPAKVYSSKRYKEDGIFKKMFDLDIKASTLYYKKYYKNRSDILKKGMIDFINPIIVKKDNK